MIDLTQDVQNFQDSLNKRIDVLEHKLNQHLGFVNSLLNDPTNLVGGHYSNAIVSFSTEFPYFLLFESFNSEESNKIKQNQIYQKTNFHNVDSSF
jgi:hypothetical protein